MRPEQQIQQALRPIRHADVMMSGATPLDDIAARRMAVQRYWNDPAREPHLAEGVLTLPPGVQHKLLIFSVHADHKIAACESAPSVDALGGLISLTRSLAGSLKEWREAA